MGIETSDLGDVPDILRGILEETLSQDASQASLDRFLPRIRDIIINLLHGLKRKQQKLRQKSGRDGSSGHDRRTGSLTSTISSMGEDTDSRSGDGRSDVGVPGRTRSSESRSNGSNSTNSYQYQQPPADPPQNQYHPPPQPSHSPNQSTHSPNQTFLASPPIPQSPANHENMQYPAQTRRSGSSGRNGEQPTQPMEGTVHTMNGASKPPIPGPYQHEPPPSTSMPMETARANPPRVTKSPAAEQQNPQARPPPKQQDALAALQRGPDLERRASRRFSAYQIQKHLGTNTAGVPMIPPTQRSPIPNRGRDMRESMNAVRTREIQRSRTGIGPGTMEEEGVSNKSEDSTATTEEGAQGPPVLGVNIPTFAPPLNSVPSISENARSTNDRNTAPSPSKSEDADRSAMRATITRPFDDPYPIPEVIEPGQSPALTPHGTTPVQTAAPQNAVPAEISPKPKSDPTFRQSRTVEAITLFLQYKTRVKKFVLSNGYQDLSTARLQLAFIEKFAWNTHSNGVDLPEIYIQDPVSGVRHELEDMNDVKNNSVLVLNVDHVDEVKRHFDENFAGLRGIIESVKSAVDEQQVTLQMVQDKQQNTAQDLARIAATPASSTRATAPTGPLPHIKGSPSQIAEVESLRRELAILRQTYASNMADMESAMSGFRAKAASVKTAALSSTTAEGSSGRAYVDDRKKSLSSDSEKIINRVDDLQDTVEDLRKDVVTRGVRPLPRQLENVSKDISAATAELRRLRDYLIREKPVWTRVGEDELQAICDDQEMLRIQEELAADLEDDLDKASQTFALVEEATKQQNLQNGPSSSSRSASRTLNPVPDVDPMKAKDTVMGEVRALQPNHESRLEAIERAERARQQELESRSNNAFKKELGTFVEDNRLKKTGGIEETERQRVLRDKMARRINHKRAAARAAGIELSLDDAALAAESDEDDGLDGVGDGVEGGLDVPERQDGAVSPEPVFVEAVEQAPGAVTKGEGE